MTPKKPRRLPGSEAWSAGSAIAVRAVCGIESLVWLTDIAGLTREQAVEQMVWSAVALVRRTAQEA